jgi:hypothetical protein
MAWGDLEIHHELLVCEICGKKYIIEEPQGGDSGGGTEVR